MNIALSSILLFALIIPFIMNFRLSYSETPYLLFGIIFALLGINVIVDLLKIEKKKYFRIKTIILVLVLLCTLGAGFVSAIIVRHQTHPVYMIHDIILQQEAAIRFFLDGVNPYATTYFGTFLEQWNYSDTEVNPALYHFVMQPFYLLFAIPFYIFGVRIFGFFDGRMPLFFLFIVMLIAAYLIPKDKEKKLQFVILMALNPAMLSYTVEGRSDVYMFAFLLGGFYLLLKRKEVLAGIPIALAFAIKQSVWPLFPFYAAYIYYRTKSVTKTIKKLSMFVITFSAVTIPFILWDTKAFFESTVFFLSGNAEHSYPISGYGLGMVLHQFGFIQSFHDQYPFVIWQVIVCIPLLIFLLWRLRKRNSVKLMIIFYTLFLFVYWYLSRYFNNSHVGYISMLLITAYFWPEEKNER